MRALRWHGRRDVRLDDVPEPGPPGPGMATVAVRLCGICGTDVAEYRDGPFMIRRDAHPLTGQAPPITLGHELAGRVVATGDGVELAVGTRVTADACWRCGDCPACRRGDYHLCRHGASIGLHSDGALAPLTTVPAYLLVPLPDAVGDEQGALSEPLAVALHGLDRGGARAGDVVLVLGFGPIGAAGALLARALGCRALVVDAAPARLARASELGFDVLEAGEDLARRLRRSTGRFGADVVLECTGVPELLPDAVACADRGATIVAVGLGKRAASLDPSRLALYERSLVGSLGYRGDVERVVAMMAARALDPTPLVGATMALEDAAAAIEQLADGAPDARVKLLVDPTGSPAAGAV